MPQIIIIDDSEIDRFILNRFIKELQKFDQGFREVESYEFACQALEYIKSCIKENQPLPVIIFLDINMPDMNGFEFLDEFEKLSPAHIEKCKVIITTSSDNAEDFETSQKYKSVKNYIKKPIHVNQIFELIQD